MIDRLTSLKSRQKRKEEVPLILSEQSDPFMGWVGRLLIWGTRNSKSEDGSRGDDMLQKSMGEQS